VRQAKPLEVSVLCDIMVRASIRARLTHTCDVACWFFMGTMGAYLVYRIAGEERTGKACNRNTEGANGVRYWSEMHR
jgi:hypothetical protein